MTDLWTGPFGDAYTIRNKTATIDARRELWKILLPKECKSILEVGANVGANLEALSWMTEGELYACEPNEMARDELVSLFHDIGESTGNITADTADKLSFPAGTADLVFTSGVLIHIPPDKLLKSVQEMYRVAKRWIIVGEYFAPQEEMIPYRGHDNAMWRRDYGGLFMDTFNDLHCIGTMFAWKRMTGLDNLTFWVFEKGSRRH
jgi:pseudaminic acid biosynthesis-associated methylase